MAASVEWEVVGGSLTVRLAGELCTWSAPRIAPLLTATIGAARPARVRFDLAAVEFIDGRGVTMLIVAMRTVEELGGSASFADPSPPARRLLEWSGVDDRIAPARST